MVMFVELCVPNWLLPSVYSASVLKWKVPFEFPEIIEESIIQPSPASLFLTMTKLGVAPNPCAIVPSDPVPV